MKLTIESGVVCTDFTLLRNWSDMPFPARNGEQASLGIDRCAAAFHGENPSVYHLSGLTEGQHRELLQLAALSGGEEFADLKAVCVFYLPKYRVSVLVNGENHLTLHCRLPGLQIEEARKGLAAVEALLQTQGTFAFHKKYGYLCPSPAAVGTGFFAGLHLHLPMLLHDDVIDDLTRDLENEHMNLIPLYPEDKELCGGFYRLCNRTTLGISREETLSKLGSVAGQLLEMDVAHAKASLEEDPEDILDYIGRAYGTESFAHDLDIAELWDDMGWLRLGCRLGVLPIPTEIMDGLFAEALNRPAIVNAENSNIPRATFMREKLKTLRDIDCLGRFGDSFGNSALSPREAVIKMFPSLEEVDLSPIEKLLSERMGEDSAEENASPVAPAKKSPKVSARKTPKAKQIDKAEAGLQAEENASPTAPAKKSPKVSARKTPKAKQTDNASPKRAGKKAPANAPKKPDDNTPEEA